MTTGSEMHAQEPLCQARRMLAFAVMLAALASLDSAHAQHSRNPRSHPGTHPPQWHGDIRHFPEHDWHLWRNGRWIHGRHAGRIGWWWVVGGAWYFYPGPVYPYPNPYEPPPMAVAPPVATVPPPPPAQYWYYCDSSGSYYPYVAVCPEGWRQVPASPAGTSARP